MSQSTAGNRRFQIRDRIAYQELGEDMVMVQADTQELHRANETAREILVGIEEGLTVENIINKIVREYSIDRETVENDVLQFIEQLKDKNLIEETEDS